MLLFRGTGRLVATRLLLCVLLVVAPGCQRAGDGAPSGVAMPLGDDGKWRQVFADDFTGSGLGRNWFAYTGVPGGDPAGLFDPSRVRIAGGVLTIGSGFDPARRKWVTGGVSNRNRLRQAYGKYQVRFRMERGRGITYAILLWPSDNSWPPEIDFAEDNGDDRGRLWATLHQRDGQRVVRSVAGDFTEWHTAGVEWTPAGLAYEIDGRVWSRVDTAAEPRIPMSLAVQSQAWPCGLTWQKCPDHTTPESVDLEVDWVAAYAAR